MKDGYGLVNDAVNKRNATISPINLGQSISGPTIRGVNEDPREPGLTAKAYELLAHLSVAYDEVSTIKGFLFADGEANSLAGPSPSSIEEALSWACQRAASLVGSLRTINTKLQ